MEASELRGDAPAPRRGEVLRLVQLREYGVAGVAAAAQLVGKSQEPARRGVAIPGVGPVAAGREGSDVIHVPVHWRQAFTGQHRDSTLEPVLGEVSIAEAHSDTRQPALALPFQVVAGAGQVVGVVVYV